MPLAADEQPAPWPGDAPARYGYLIAHDGPPAPRGLIADVVLDGAGLYLAAATAGLAIRVRLARVDVPDLPIAPMGVTLARGPIDGTLWEALVDRARDAMPHEVLLAIVARQVAEGEFFVAAAGPYSLVEPGLDETGTGTWQPQQASASSVRATPIPDALVEVHSHHALPAYFSDTDDRDETARRVYGVLGRLDTPSPELALRVATGCRPQATESVPFAQVFAGGLGAFRDVPFSDDTSVAPGADVPLREARLLRHPLPSPLLGLALGMAEDLAAIRAQVESRRRPEVATAPFWTP